MISTLISNQGMRVWHVLMCFPSYFMWQNRAHVNCPNKDFLGRSLMIGWRKKSWNPERVPSVFTFVCVCLSVCVCVCTRATDHSFWARNLIFGLSDPWNIRKKRIFFFRNFHFSMFSLYNTSGFPAACLLRTVNLRPSTCGSHEYLLDAGISRISIWPGPWLVPCSEKDGLLCYWADPWW